MERATDWSRFQVFGGSSVEENYTSAKILLREHIQLSHSLVSQFYCSTPVILEPVCVAPQARRSASKNWFS